LYAGADALAVPRGRRAVEIVRRDGTARVRVRLPFAERGSVRLARHGDELAVTVGSSRRIIALPSALRSARVADARLRDGALVVRFEDRGGRAPETRSSPDADEEVS
jgi:arsenite-transporting ATPase